MLKNFRFYFDNRTFFDSLRALRSELDPRVAKLVGFYLSSNIKLSKFLGKNKDFVNDYRKKNRVSQILATSVLDDFILSITNRFKRWRNLHLELVSKLNETEAKFIRIINTYKMINNPKLTPRSQILAHHPNLNENFFKIINTVEKAYWLGIFYSDGYIGIEKKRSGDYYRIGIALKDLDEIIVYGFCKAIGGNPSYVRPEKIKSISGKYIDMKRFRVTSNKLAKDLISHGIIPGKGKSSVIRLPNLGTDDMTSVKIDNLYLAFLLGYFDGDGTLSKNKYQASIFASNKIFLEDIKKHFGIKSIIQEEEKEIYDPNRDVFFTSKVNKMTLPVCLFKDMMSIELEGGSLQRKRREDFSYKKRKNKVKDWIKEVLPKQTMEELMECYPLSTIAKLLKVNIGTLRSVVEEYHLEPRNVKFWNAKVLKLGHPIEISEHWLNYFKKLHKNS